MDLNETIASQMELVDCAACHIQFALFKSHVNRLRETHKGFYCPNGHSLVFNGETEEDKLRKKLEAAERSAQFYRQQSERRAREAQLKKCPHCPKQVIHLVSHIKRRHPDAS